MKTIISDENEIISKAAELACSVLRKKSDAVIALVGGRSVEGLYRKLAEICAAGELSFKNARFLGVADYVAAPKEKSHSHQIKEKFLAYCKTLGTAFGNPLYHWSQVELKEYFNRCAGTIKNNIIKMNKATNGIYRYKKDGKYIISKQGIEWLCKNCFKQKYLELLEDYKMELTQKYMDEGYIYDNFLLRR